MKKISFSTLMLAVLAVVVALSTCVQSATMSKILAAKNDADCRLAMAAVSEKSHDFMETSNSLWRDKNRSYSSISSKVPNMFDKGNVSELFSIPSPMKYYEYEHFTTLPDFGAFINESNYSLQDEPYVSNDILVIKYVLHDVEGIGGQDIYDTYAAMLLLEGFDLHYNFSDFVYNENSRTLVYMSTFIKDDVRVSIESYLKPDSDGQMNHAFLIQGGNLSSLFR